MNDTFRRFVESLDAAYQNLMIMEPFTVPTLPQVMPQLGIYLFSEGEKYLYVGRTNRLRQSLQEHCRASATHNSATFAFRLAREATGKVQAAYTGNGSRSVIEKEPEFKSAFTAAKLRVRNMQVRFVGESDPMRQALLELYVSVCLATPYNDFDNH
jgi:predicted GIY-YIG superfamily endonuclease